MEVHTIEILSALISFPLWWTLSSLFKSFGLDTFLINEPELYTVKNISNRQKHLRILNRLDSEVFTQSDIKWESVQNGMDWLVKKESFSMMR